MKTLTNDEAKKISKFFSYVLRHHPESISLQLDPQGWANISELIRLSNNPNITDDVLRYIVATNDKQRFALSDDGQRIRANQGHSIDIELALPAIEPPATLLHGTGEKHLEAILREGLQKMQRHHVHLTESQSIAKAVGARYGKPVCLEINSAEMATQGHTFYKTANHVWLCDAVPAEFIRLCEWTS